MLHNLEDLKTTQEEVQAVFHQLNDLSFKLSAMYADWQQQKGQNPSSSSAQNRVEHEPVVGSRSNGEVHMRPQTSSGFEKQQ